MRWIALIVLAAACGDNVPAIPFDSYAARHREAECEREVRCGLFSTIAACKAYAYTVPDQSLAAAIADHRVRYSELRALQCVEQLADRTCDGGTPEGRAEPAACDAVFLGSIATGDTCAFDAECASARCMQSACDPATCCAGVCIAATRSAVSGTCSLDRDCVADTYCGIDHACHALGDNGAPCYRDTQCNFGLGCVTQTNPGVCRPLAASGEPCPAGECALVGEHCNAAMTCAPFGLSPAACSQNSDCSPMSVCDATTSTCSELPEAGMPCTLRCAGDAWCDVSTNRCQARFERSTPCNTDSQCVTSYCAEGDAFDYCTDRPVCD